MDPKPGDGSRGGDRHGAAVHQAGYITLIFSTILK